MPRCSTPSPTQWFGQLYALSGQNWGNYLILGMGRASRPRGCCQPPVCWALPSSSSLQALFPGTAREGSRLQGGRCPWLPIYLPQLEAVRAGSQKVRLRGLGTKAFGPS